MNYKKHERLLDDLIKEAEEFNDDLKGSYIVESYIEELYSTRYRLINMKE